MLVSGGKTLLGQQAAGHKKSKSRDNDAKSFQDLLSGAQKKKAAPKKKVQKKAMSTSKKKLHKNDGVDDNQYVQKRRENPVKKKMEGQRQPQQPKVVAQQEQPKTQKVMKQEMPNKMEALQQENMVDKKFAEMNGKGIELDASLTSSASQNKTLGKSEKIMQAMESSFEEVMSQMKGQGQANKGMNAMAAAQGNQKLTGEQVNNLVNQNGRKKIDTSMKLSSGMETLEIGEAHQSKALKGLTKGAEDQGQDSLAKGMDSQFAQMLEAEVQTEGVDNSQFNQELTVAQEGGNAEKIENMQSIIKQARAVIDDGGGSMEIHLQPEGLGKVHLKVAVQEGQVNVEMMTDNPAAKKALEEGLFDIKNALEGQKLLVETLKVEMSPDYQKDFSDLQQHMQEQANRDFAEQFLGQFKQEREERFGGMFDSFRNFQRGPKEPELTLSRNPYTENGKGRSVNLVA